MADYNRAHLDAVVNAIKIAISTTNTPGLAVNHHPNPYFLNVVGELNLEHIAKRVLLDLSRFYEAEKKRQEADAATAASAVDGH